VLAANDGFMLCDILINEQLRQEIDQILKKLENFGMIFCSTDQLHSTFQKMLQGAKSVKTTPAVVKSETRKEKSADAKTLVTAKVIHMAVDEKLNSITLAPGGIVTPLARDLAKEYSIKILKSQK